jgi:hypothetical protein
MAITEEDFSKVKADLENLQDQLKENQKLLAGFFHTPPSPPENKSQLTNRNLQIATYKSQLTNRNLQIATEYLNISISQYLILKQLIPV